MSTPDLQILLAGSLHLPLCPRDMLCGIPAAVIGLLPAEVAAEYQVVPIGFDTDGDLRVAMVDPANANALCEVEFFTGRRAMREVACGNDIAEALAAYYGVQQPVAA